MGSLLERRFFVGGRGAPWQTGLHPGLPPPRVPGPEGGCRAGGSRKDRSLTKWPWRPWFRAPCQLLGTHGNPDNIKGGRPTASLSDRKALRGGTTAEQGASPQQSWPHSVRAALRQARGKPRSSVARALLICQEGSILFLSLPLRCHL